MDMEVEKMIYTEHIFYDLYRMRPTRKHTLSGCSDNFIVLRTALYLIQAQGTLKALQELVTDEEYELLVSNIQALARDMAHTAATLPMDELLRNIEILQKVNFLPDVEKDERLVKHILSDHYNLSHIGLEPWLVQGEDGKNYLYSTISFKDLVGYTIYHIYYTTLTQWCIDRKNKAPDEVLYYVDRNVNKEMKEVMDDILAHYTECLSMSSIPLFRTVQDAFLAVKNNIRDISMGR